MVNLEPPIYLAEKCMFLDNGRKPGSTWKEHTGTHKLHREKTQTFLAILSL